MANSACTAQNAKILCEVDKALVSFKDHSVIQRMLHSTRRTVQKTIGSCQLEPARSHGDLSPGSFRNNVFVAVRSKLQRANLGCPLDTKPLVAAQDGAERGIKRLPRSRQGCPRTCVDC